MAAAAYYQQLSLSLSGNLNGGIPTPGQLFQAKDGHVTSQIATALASNPYLIHPAPSPPYSVQGTSNSINRMSFQRYYSLPEQLTSCPDSLPNNLSLRNQVKNNNNQPFAIRPRGGKFILPMAESFYTFTCKKVPFSPVKIE